jgi:hypothetical protein
MGEIMGNELKKGYFFIFFACQSIFTMYNAYLFYACQSIFTMYNGYLNA